MIEKVITMKSFIQVQIPGIILPSLRYIHTDQFLATHTNQFLATHTNQFIATHTDQFLATHTNQFLATHTDQFLATHTDQFLATHTDQFLAIVLMLVTLLTVLMGRHLQLQMWILMIV